tara:strand:- start:2701 stop:2853 length:153 start_codon:yes stop_codon:yes gene_type:complete
MKIFRRNFLRMFVTSLSIIPFIKFDTFFPYYKKRKLKKNKNFIWYLNDND